jgi:fluoride exporter
MVQPPRKTMPKTMPKTIGWQSAIAVSIGAIVGAEVRYLAGELMQATVGESWSSVSTFGVNLIGCWLLAFVLTLNAEPFKWVSSPVQLMLTVGFCGSLTTFSTYVLEIVTFAMQGHWGKAIGYGWASMAGGLSATWLGVQAGKLIRS